MGGFSIGHWVVILLIFLLIFGTSKLKNIGSDLGSAIKGFKKAMSEDDKKNEKNEDQQNLTQQSDTIKKDLDTSKSENSDQSNKPS